MFALFAGYNYYPAGGWRDFQGVYGTLEAAIEGFKNHELTDWDWGHVVDLHTLKITYI